MSKYLDASQTLTKEIDRLKTLQVLGDALAAIGTLDQAADEAQARLNALQRQEADEQAKISRAAEIIEEAKRTADAIIAEARKGKAAIDAEVKAADSDLSRREAQIADAKVELEHVKNESAAVSAEISRLRAFFKEK